MTEKTNQQRQRAVCRLLWAALFLSVLLNGIAVYGFVLNARALRMAAANIRQAEAILNDSARWGACRTHHLKPEAL
jgi:hypothetical protein